MNRNWSGPLVMASGVLSLSACAVGPSEHGLRDAGIEPVSTEQLFSLHEGNPARAQWARPRAAVMPGELFMDGEPRRRPTSVRREGQIGTAEFFLDGTWTLAWDSERDSGEYYVATGQVCQTLARTAPQVRCLTYYPTTRPNEFQAFAAEGEWMGTLRYEP